MSSTLNLFAVPPRHRWEICEEKAIFGHHRLASSGLVSPTPKTAEGPVSARRWSSLSAQPSSMHLLCLDLPVVLTLSATLSRSVSLPSCRTSVLVLSIFFLLRLLWLIFCLSLFFLAPPIADFCQLLISFFFLISFPTFVIGLNFSLRDTFFP